MDESDETLTVTLSAPSYATVPAAGFSVSATVTRSSVTYGPVAVDHDTPAPAYTRILQAVVSLSDRNEWREE